MNLEINLLKEKQKTNKGFFEIQNMMGGNQIPPTHHIIKTNEKFQ